MAKREGWEGWDQYAPFYDWENARTLGRRDVAFWRRMAASVRGPVLELGCGTGRIALPLARAGATLVGIDRSGPMLDRAQRRAKALRARAGAGRRRGRLSLVRGDIRHLPFDDGRFAFVIAAYGVLQSLLSEQDLHAALDSACRVLKPGGTLGIDLVPDVPQWREYDNRVQLRGRFSRGAHLTLVESVSQQPRRRLTIFEQRYVERRGRAVREHTFQLAFRTLSVPEMTRRLVRAGFRMRAVLGDYRGRAWDERADVWILLAEKV
jgi:ubiquinone/menaquinone biosynthesis C-methylase UbiE